MTKSAQGVIADPAGRPLQESLEAAAAEAAKPLTREEVTEIIQAVCATMEGDVSVTDLKLYGELQSLARYIQHAKQEIAAIRPDEISSSHIPSATDELDAVVGATEEATNQIMDACDAISDIATRVDSESGAALTQSVTSIFEACNFQDITGQRITKVVKTLKHIETKVEALLRAFGDEVEKATQAASATSGDLDFDSKLLNGPQLPSNAIDQDEIDKLLASFD